MTCKDHQARIGDKMLDFYKQLRADKSILGDQRYVLYLAHMRKIRSEIAKNSWSNVS